MSINSKVTAISIAVIILISHYLIREFNYNHWSNTLGWDVLAYYLFLPFTFIYHDPGMVNQSVIEHIFQVYEPSSTFYQAYQIPNGNWVSVYTLGFAILFAPFFFIAHLWATVSSTYPADGFSFPYQYCIANGVMIYIVAGIFILRKVLLHFFSDRITSLVLILLLLGTNYFHEATSEETMPHAILFAGYAWMLWLVIRWHEKPKMRTAAWLGFVLGFMILSRGSELLALAIPILYNVYDKASVKAKLNLLKQHYKQIIVAAATFMIVPFIQMIQWKFVTGSWVFYSYQNTEGFDWNGEHISKVLFSYKKGWFVYTPMIILPIIGIWFMRKMNKEAFWSVTIFFITNFYLLSSWAAWWQGGSFSMRYFVESYAVMAIPFGFFIQKVTEQKLLLRTPVFLIAFFFLFLNLFQTWQFNKWWIDGYAMTKEYYWRIFLKTNVSDEDKKLKEISRTFVSLQPFTDPENYNQRTIGFADFDSINTIFIEPEFLDTSVFLSPPYSCRITKEKIYSPTFRIPFNQITKKEHAFIRVSFYYYAAEEMKDTPASLGIYLDHKNRFVNGFRGLDLEKENFKPNEWNLATFEYLTPYPLSWNDRLTVFVYLRGDKPVWIDNFKVDAFERKW